MTDLLNNYRLEKQAEEERAKAEQERAYNEIMTTVRNGEYNTVADLEKYLGIVKGEGSSVSFGDGSISAGLSDIQRQNLLNLYQTIASDPDQQAADQELKEVQASSAKASFKDDDAFLWFGRGNSAGNNFEVEIDDEKYNVQYGDEVNDKAKLAKLKKAVENPADGVVFEYDGSIYIYQGGKYREVKPRATNDADYNDLYADLTGKSGAAT